MPLTKTQIVRKAKQRGVQLVRFLYCDNGGIIRGKTTHVDHLTERMDSGIGLVMGMMSMTSLDFLAPNATYGPVGEIRLIPDPDTFTILPYAPRSAQMVCDLIKLDHTPWELDPRSFLKRMIARAEQQGLYVDAVFENEFTLARAVGAEFNSAPTSGAAPTYGAAPAYMPIDRSLCFSGLGMDSAEVVMQDIVEALTAQRLIVEQYMPELAPAQQELSIRHAPALRAADNQITFRQTVRAIAAQHNLIASFAPKPFADQAGNGAHIHWSAWNRKHTRNLFVDRRDRFGLSKLAYQFIAGVLKHLPALLALSTPSVNSYRRLQPHFWSSAYTAWGIENREAAVRVPSRFWGHEAGSTNLELKASDPSNNPYLALGGLIAAGLDGIENGLEPGEPVDQDPANLSEEERAQRGIRRYPTSLDAALDELERDEVLLDSLGEPLAKEYRLVKRAEADAFKGKGDEYELQQHFYKY